MTLLFKKVLERMDEKNKVKRIFSSFTSDFLKWSCIKHKTIILCQTWVSTHLNFLSFSDKPEVRLNQRTKLRHFAWTVCQKKILCLGEMVFSVMEWTAVLLSTFRNRPGLLLNGRTERRPTWDTNLPEVFSVLMSAKKIVCAFVNVDLSTH